MEITNIEIIEQQIVVHVQMERRVSECPTCGALTDTLHDCWEQTVKDLSVLGKALIWIFSDA